jgi:lactoylglutathione lyase
VAVRDDTQLATMLCVVDLECSLDFYGRLGFSLVDKGEDVALLALGAGQLYLFLESPPTPDKPELHLEPPRPNERPSTILVLRVPDARAVYAELRARGVEFLTPPKSPPWGGWRCFARDPTVLSSRSRTTRARGAEAVQQRRGWPVRTSGSAAGRAARSGPGSP